MACVVVPFVEAIVTSCVAKAVKSYEKEPETIEIQTENGIETVEKIQFSTKLGWLSKLLYGGAALVGFEHVWHGEIVPFFPFLTGAMNPADTAVMLEEMSTVGVTMAVLLTSVWGVMLMITNIMQKKAIGTKSLAK